MCWRYAITIQNNSKINNCSKDEKNRLFLSESCFLDGMEF